MTQNQITRAHATLSKMAQFALPVRDSYNLYMLIKKLEPHYNFTIEREKALINQYSATIQEDGMIRFEDHEKVEGFRREMNELRNMDVELDFEPIELSFDALEGKTITPEDIACLEGFISFV